MSAALAWAGGLRSLTLVDDLSIRIVRLPWPDRQPQHHCRCGNHQESQAEFPARLHCFTRRPTTSDSVRKFHSNTRRLY